MIARKLTIVMAAAFAVLQGTNAGAQAVVVEETTTETTVAADAGEASAYSGKALYFSAGGVLAFENNNSALGTGGVNDSAGVPVSGYGDLSESGGYDLRLGYAFEKWFAAELEWQSMLSFSTDATDVVTGNNMPSVEARMMSLNGRFSPLTGRFQPYALLGMGWVNVQADRQANSIHVSSFGMKFGAGLAFMITERTGVALEAAYILPMSGVIGHGERFDIIPITASVFFRFT